MSTPIQQRRHLFQKGAPSPNPGGHDKLTRWKAGEMAKLSIKAIKVLGANLDDEDARVRHAAAVEILNRVDGKPKQQVDVAVTTVDLTAQHLAALRQLASMPLLDVTPSASCPSNDAPNGAQHIDR